MKFRKLAVGLTIAASAAFFAPIANAAPVDVANGMSIKASNGISCSVGAVGTDSAGRKVALTAGHCVEGAATGSPITLNGNTIGTVTDNRSNRVGLDYAVIALGDVNLKSQGPYGRIDKLGPEPANWQQICKHGATTARTCGVVSGNNSGNVWTFMLSLPGDSGSGFVQGTGLVAILRGFDFSGQYGGIGVYGTNIRTALADINSRPGTPGAGFVVTNN